MRSRSGSKVDADSLYGVLSEMDLNQSVGNKTSPSARSWFACMLPVAHAAVGVLAYSLVQVCREWRDLSAVAVVAAVAGSQFPDVLDKPLAYFQLLPSGRSLGHSLLFLAVVGLVLWRLAPEEYGESALAFCVAACSHVLADGYRALLPVGGVQIPGYLLWPITQAPRYGETAAPWVRLSRIYSTPSFGTQTLVLLTAAGVVLACRAALALPGTPWEL